jgi:hypothetical protein
MALLVTLFPYLTCNRAQRYSCQLPSGLCLQILAREFSLTGYLNKVLAVQLHRLSITLFLQLLPKKQAGEPEDNPGLDQCILQSGGQVIQKGKDAVENPGISFASG